MPVNPNGYQMRKTAIRIMQSLPVGFSYKRASFSKIVKNKRIYLYAGDVPNNDRYLKFTGLSLHKSDRRHIKHDVSKTLPLKDGSVDIYQSEDVFEHIDPGLLPSIINEIHRVLKVGGILRISMPDYRCDLLRDRTVKDELGNLLFDPCGGGDFVDGRVTGGGHVWFPVYESVKAVLEKSAFEEINFYHYYDSEGNAVTKFIDYSIGYVQRTPDHDSRVQNPYRPMSIVVDCRKVSG